MNLPAALDNLTLKQLLLLAAGFSLFMLSAAFIGQFGFGLPPCELCVYQRYPYVAIAVIALLAAWRAPHRMQVTVAFLCAALFFLDAGIAFYHTGVEYGWFPGLSGCSSASTGNETLEELRAQIMNAPLVTCDQAMVYIFGLSMAAWNFLGALAAGITMFHMTLRIGKRLA